MQPKLSHKLHFPGRDHLQENKCLKNLKGRVHTLSSLSENNTHTQICALKLVSVIYATVYTGCEEKPSQSHFKEEMLN